MGPPSPCGPWPPNIPIAREKGVSNHQSYLVQMWGEAYPSDKEHSVFEDEDDFDEHDVDYADDDDRSSSLSVPNESIDFHLVYSRHNFAGTVEDQASVVKGDSLVLMDDSNSYWWLVRVLKSQEVGYIPAENIETAFERLGRLNGHRNVDLASPTQAEMQDGLQKPRAHFCNTSSRAGRDQQSPLLTPCNDPRVMTCSSQRARRFVIFTPTLQVHRYPPAVWGDDSDDGEVDGDDEYDVGGYEAAFPEQERHGGGDLDDVMSWEGAPPDPSRVPAQVQPRQQGLQAQQLQQQSQQQQEVEHQATQQHQQQQCLQTEEQRRQQYIMAQTIPHQAAATSTLGPDRLTIRPMGSRGQLVLPQGSSSSVSPCSSSTSARFTDPIDASEAKMVVSSTSTSFMDTDPVSRDGARLPQTISTTFTETALQNIPDAVVEVPTGFAISSEAPACGRRHLLLNYKTTRRKKSSLPVLNPDIEVSVWSDDDQSTIDKS